MNISENWLLGSGQKLPSVSWFLPLTAVMTLVDVAVAVMLLESVTVRVTVKLPVDEYA